MSTSSGERLRKAIMLRGYRTRAAFAEEVGEKAGTVRQHVNRGSVPKDVAEKYARRLKVPLDWLLYGKGRDPFAKQENTASSSNSSTDVEVISSTMVERAEEKRASQPNDEGNQEVTRTQCILEIGALLASAPTEAVKDVRNYLRVRVATSESQNGVEQQHP